MSGGMITRALFVRLEAKTGREQEVEDFLRSALDLVDAEDGTPLWFALRFGPSTFGIFDAFPSDEARRRPPLGPGRLDAEGEGAGAAGR